MSFQGYVFDPSWDRLGLCAASIYNITFLAAGIYFLGTLLGLSTMRGSEMCKLQ